MNCLEHSGFKTAIEDIKEGAKEVWKAIDLIREENKKTAWRVGVIVGIGVGLQAAITLILK
jgi:hypothetical protein